MASQGQAKNVYHSSPKKPHNSVGSDQPTEGQSSGVAVTPIGKMEGYGYVDSGFTGAAFSQPSHHSSVGPQFQTSDGYPNGSAGVDQQISDYPNFQGKRLADTLVADNRKKPKPGQKKGVKPSPIGTTLVTSVPHAPVQAGVKGFSKLVKLIGTSYLPGFKDESDKLLFEELLCAASAHVLRSFVERMSAKFRPVSFEKVDVEIPLPPVIMTAIGGYAVVESDDIKYYPHLPTLENGIRRWQRMIGFPDWDDAIYMVQWSKLCSRYETSTRRPDSFTVDIPDRSLLLTSSFSDGGGDFWIQRSRGCKLASRVALSRRYELIGAALAFHTGEEGGSPYNVFIPKLSPSEIHLHPVLSSTRFSTRGMTSLDLELELMM
jgi:hypothetical protein